MWCSSTEEIDERISTDVDELGYQILIEDTVAQAAPTVSEECEDDTDGDLEDDILVEASVISHANTAEMLNDCLRWYERQDEATATSILLLKRANDLAHKKD